MVGWAVIFLRLPFSPGALAIGTFALFLPHAFLWGMREFLTKEKKNGQPAAAKESD
jgi:hypothetical protein